MEYVNVKTTDLLTILKQNRKDHRAQFEEALDGYTKECEEQLRLRLEQLRAGKKISMAFSMPEPQDMTSEFDNLIALLELTTDVEIELTPSEARNYVSNDWDWLRAATMSNSRYTKAWKAV